MQHAELVTGLQITVYLGAVGEDARADAERLFVSAGRHQRPAVLLLVAPDSRRVEIVTAPAVQGRVSDAICEAVVRAMVEHFGRGEIERGILVGLERLAGAVGPGPAGDREELPDVFARDDRWSG